MFHFSHGVEQEFQIVDQNGNLASAFDEIIKYVPESYKKPNVKGFRYIWQDDYKTQFEISTGVCWTYDRLKYWLEQLRGIAVDAARYAGYSLIAAGSNPIRDLNPQEFFSEQHHIGVTGKEGCRVLNAIRNRIHSLISYSVNSPFHESLDTGFKSYRMANAVAIGPISGLPYMQNSMSAEEFRTMLRKDPRQLDATPISDWNTIEVRFFDSQPSINLALSNAILLQALSKRAMKEKPPFVQQSIISKNRRIAIRFGLSARFEGVPAPQSLRNFITHIEDEIEDMGFSKKDLTQWRMIENKKTFADWQISMHKEGGFQRLCRNLIKYTGHGKGPLG